MNRKWDAADVRDAAMPRLLIQFQDVSFTYPGPPRVEALLSTDLEIHRGDYVAIIGRSGSGKSTLLNIIGLLDRPTTGQYIFDGLDTSQLNDADRAALRGRRIGFVFQSFHLLPHRTAQENVALALLYHGISKQKRTKAAEIALDRVGLSHRLDALPTQMSGGEQQRVAIARALASQPLLLLCDEPTGNLDSVSAGIVLDLIDDLRSRGLTVVIITHDRHVAARGERTVLISDGSIIDQQTELTHLQVPGGLR
jgi:putative ABC transport system ATP-binding protein